MIFEGCAPKTTFFTQRNLELLITTNPSFDGIGLKNLDCWKIEEAQQCGMKCGWFLDIKNRKCTYVDLLEGDFK